MPTETGQSVFAGISKPRPRAERPAMRSRWLRMTGSSPAARKMEAAILRIAEFQCTTLITGETGCGKEEVARAIHAAGPRRAAPFVSLNCGGLPASLAESQLFGHAKGAFTGAIGATLGAFRAAQGGVVFLDEIGELPLEIQPKLLQVLERREVTPVGTTQTEPVDVQVIAATNRDLDVEVERGNFREDLVYRLNTVHVVVPPLRERPEDIPRFIGHFSAHFAAEYNREPWTPDPDVLARFMAYGWPGNVRQLAQTVQRLYVFADSADSVLDELFGAKPARHANEHDEARSSAGAIRSSAHQAFELPATFNIREMRKHLVRSAIAASNGQFAKAAKLLGVSPNTMTKLVAEACPEISKKRERRSPRPR